MKRIGALLVTLLVITSCSKESIRGSGSITSESRTVETFSAVRVEGSTTVELLQGPQQSVQISGYQNLIPIFETNVQNGTLVLKFDSRFYNIQNNNVRVLIVVPSINRVAVNGSGKLYASNFSGADFSADINGSGDINIANSTYVRTHYKVNGSGKISAGQLISKEAEAEISGSGKIDLHCTEKLTARISGSGDVHYWGNPGFTHTEVSGSGKVTRK